jgi:hypothetical protein
MASRNSGDKAMSNTNTGGQAFPNEGFNGWGKPEEGMTLRDYFAAKAMQSVFPLCKTYAYAAQECYAIADAMLKAREA